MTIEQSLIVALRHRLVPGCISADNYQRIGDLPPENSPLYVRESFTPLTVSEPFQTKAAYRYLAQFDIFLRRGADVNVTAELFRVAEMIRNELNPRDPAKIDLALPGWSGAKACIERVVNYDRMTQEVEFYQLPTQAYITLFMEDNATYTEPEDE